MAGLVSGVEVGLLLWRTQLRMFVNQTVRSGKPGRIVGSVIGGAIILVAWAWEALITGVGVEAAHRFRAPVDATHLLSLGFLGYTGVLVFSSLVFSLNALLLNPDLDLLLAAPRPVESILAGRMVLQVIRLFLLSLLFTGPALLVLAYASHNPLIPIVFSALYLLYPVFVVVIISLMSLLLVRIIPSGRGREILTLFGVAVAVGINLLNFLLNPALRDAGFARRSGSLSLPDIPGASAPWLPSGWAGRSAAAALGGDWLTAISWALVLLALYSGSKTWERLVIAVLAVSAVRSSRNEVWLVLFIAVPAARALAGSRSWRAVVPPAAASAVTGLLVLVTIVGLTRAPVSTGAAPKLLETAARSAGGTPILADGVDAEQLALAGKRILIGNPLDAFPAGEQQLYLDWLAGRPAGDAEATRVRVVLVTKGSAAQHRLAARRDFRELARDKRAVLYVRRNRHASGTHA